MSTTDYASRRLGSYYAFKKLGMSAAHRVLIQRLQNAVVDEHEGAQEYAETAEEAAKQKLPQIEHMARAHEADEKRHGKENTSALHQLYLRE